ncbi:hypothetical protein AA0120_g2688 [Alternaria tenuissima]|nr:hypothetical protein AA0120_g2688 [Alternaria tenuissima]
MPVTKFCVTHPAAHHTAGAVTTVTVTPAAINSNDGFICPGSGFGDCCSVYGWCGSSSGHCDGGCQTAYGTCNAQANALTARDAWMSMAPVTRLTASVTTLAATQVA